jgi:diadenosine tetraphosphate (Ap4A) HIT family hydrolase
MTKTWMSRERWDALVRGEDCLLCEVAATLTAPDAEDDYGFTIAEMSAGILRLQKNQYVAGYTTLISKRHVCEIYEFTPAERVEFFADLARASHAITQAYDALKINLSILGNSTPHLHAHIIPRYYGDPSPDAPIDPWTEKRYLADYTEPLRLIRAALAQIP